MVGTGWVDGWVDEWMSRRRKKTKGTWVPGPGSSQPICAQRTRGRTTSGEDRDKGWPHGRQS